MGKSSARAFTIPKMWRTKVDLAMETNKAYKDLILNHLRKHYQDHKLIGEEAFAALGATTDLTDDSTWIVDPLDGTTKFVHRSFTLRLPICVCLDWPRHLEDSYGWSRVQPHHE